MTYLRYAVTPSTYNPHQGQFSRVNHVMTMPDGKILWKIELDDTQLDTLDDVPGVVFPSLNAPASKLSVATQTWITSRGLTIDAGDAVIDILRKVRNQLGFSFKQVRLESDI
jgi:hypothetical protein